MDGYLCKPIRAQELDAVLDLYMHPEPNAGPGDPLPGAGRKEDEHVIQTDDLMERVDGDLAFLAELVDIFSRDYPAQIRQLQQALTDGDALAVRRLGHTLKGALSNLSAPRASALAASIEEMGQAENLSRAGVAVAGLEEELKSVENSLRALCPELVQ
jgi:HPt (histidine-containing phosphotransfer) domain-containing protein